MQQPHRLCTLNMLKPFSSGETGTNQVEANSDARKTEHIEVELQGEENQLGWRAVGCLGFGRGDAIQVGWKSLM